MSSKDLRRFAGEKWRKNWPSILLAFFLLFVVYIALAICFSFVLSPFLALTIMSPIEGLRREISLSISGILLAFLFFALIFYLILGGCSFIYMALKMVRGEKVSPFDIFYSLNLKAYPMQKELIDYSLFYASVPWLFSALSILLFGFGPSNPVLEILQELFFDFCLGIFLLFYLCAPFLLLERKAKSLKDALLMSSALMHHERMRFFGHVLYFLGIRLLIHVISGMWGFTLNNSFLPSILSSVFFSFFLTPYFILLQAGFYQEILDKKKRLVKVGRSYAVLRSEEEEEAIAEAFSTLMQDVEKEKVEKEKVETEKAETENTETEKIEKEKTETEKAETEKTETEKTETEKTEPEKEEPEKAETEKLEETKAECRIEEELPEVKEVEEKRKEEPEDIAEEKSAAEESEEPAKEEAEEKSEDKEKLSFEEARKRYTNYKEES